MLRRKQLQSAEQRWERVAEKESQEGVTMMESFTLGWLNLLVQVTGGQNCWACWLAGLVGWVGWDGWDGWSDAFGLS